MFATTKRKLSMLVRALREAANAIVRGDFFGSSLQNQLVTLEALQETLRSLGDLKKQNEALALKIHEVNESLGLRISEAKEGQALEWSKANEALTLKMREANEAMARGIGEIAKATNSTQATWLGMDDQNEPEEAVIRFLLPFLKEKTAIDVGAHRGSFTKALLEMGFVRVWAVEPHPLLAGELTQAHGNDPRVAILPLALGSENGDAKLHLAAHAFDSAIPEDPLLFSALIPRNLPPGLELSGETIAVQVRTIRSLAEEGRLPEKAGLLKVDAEGGDLAVFLGMNGTGSYEILMSEFWSPDFVFATPGIPGHEAACEYLAGAGYPFSISIVRKADRSLCWTANMPVALRQTWGNTLYFRDAALFQAGMSFVSKFLPGPALSDAPVKP